MPAWAEKLKPGRPVKHGRFFTSRARDCRGCDLARLCLSKGRVNKAVVLGDDYPALLRARRRRERWSEEDRLLYQRHRWRSEGLHGEAKTWRMAAATTVVWALGTCASALRIKWTRGLLKNPA